MNLAVFLTELRAQGVEIWLESGKLRYRAPVGVVDVALKAELSRHKETLVSYLTLAGGKLPEDALDPALVRRPALAPLPLTAAQESLWFLHQFEPESDFFHETALLRLTGALDIDVLRQAAGALAARHSILRTAIDDPQGDPIQIIHPSPSIDLEVEVLEQLPAEDRLAAAQNSLRRAARTPFDMSAAPLWRLRVARLSAGEHLLLVVMHQVIGDAWSLEVFLKELMNEYSAQVDGQAAETPPNGLQYADYTVWQLLADYAPASDAARDAWKNRLSGAPDFLALPIDRSRPAVQTFAGQRIDFQLNPWLCPRLRELATNQVAGLSQILQTAFALLLGRYSGQKELVLGMLVSRRTRPEIDGMLGPLANSLPVRIDLSPDASGGLAFTTLLQRVDAAVSDAQSRQELPFEKIVTALGSARSLSYSALFQAAIQYQPVTPALETWGAVQTERLPFDAGVARFDLTLIVRDDGRDLSCALEYNTDLFEHETIERLAGHFQVLLNSIVADPGGLVDRLEMLPEAERRQLLCGWNQTTADYPRLASLVDLFTEQVRTLPESLAVTYGAASLTYAGLEAASNRLARYLRRLGAGREMLVGLSLERSVEMVVGMLGILKTGGAYLPLDPGHPAERLAYMLADSGAQIVVTAAKHTIPRFYADEASGTNPGLQVVAVDSAEVQAESPAAPEPVSGALDLAYVMYTSGSTGRPKGIAIPQRAVVRLVKGSDYLQIEAGERVAQASNMSFDAATWEIWGALLNGATLVGLEADVLLSPPAYADALRSRKVNHALVTTALFNQIAAVQPDAFNSLQTVLFGGEAVTPGWVRAVLAAGGPQRLLHVYGPTESTTFATWQLVEAVAEGVRTLPIGRPIANTTAYVLDEARQPAPLGVAGELYLGGDGLARGYWKRPELTAEKFIRNPFVAGPEGPDGDAAKEPDAEPVDPRLYATGDLVRRLADGALEYLGRIDRQVKLRGFRIELGEIEAAAAEHLQVEAVAVELYGEGEEKRLVGYVVWRGGEAGEVRQLREHLTRRLPGYMLPAQWVSLESLPLNPNGKLDRRRLPPPPRMPRQSARKPETSLQQVLANLWAEVLGVESVGVDDHFFDLGGHSLLAIRLMARIQQLLQVEAPVRLIYAAPDLAGFAARLQSTCSHDLEPVARLILQLLEMPDEAVEALLSQNSADLHESTAD